MVERVTVVDLGSVAARVVDSMELYVTEREGPKIIKIARNTSNQVRNRSETSLINRPFHPQCPLIWVIGFVKFEIWRP